ncbi:8892_t:CDS:2 [Cetraspora pellucida]|uniref:8892_t:CDS:1 n=1 Tax=Cetraspora pellucida TaxID=1433469 RepID=A0A9N8YUU4_9GLOM|nr:8892_t:CDS:2 [Cetraspora pellucida]
MNIKNLKDIRDKKPFDDLMGINKPQICPKMKACFDLDVKAVHEERPVLSSQYTR